MIAKNVSDWTHKDFFSIMDTTAVEVLMIANIIQEQVTVEQAKQGQI